MTCFLAVNRNASHNNSSQKSGKQLSFHIVARCALKKHVSETELRRHVHETHASKSGSGGAANCARDCGAPKSASGSSLVASNHSFRLFQLKLKNDCVMMTCCCDVSERRRHRELLQRVERERRRSWIDDVTSVASSPPSSSATTTTTSVVGRCCSHLAHARRVRSRRKHHNQFNYLLCNYLS